MLSRVSCWFAVLLLVACTAAADSIPTNGYVPINGQGGSVVYDPDPSIYGFGTVLGGGTYSFGASGVPLSGGRFATGYLNVITPSWTLSGVLSGIFFNPTTGLFRAAFQGQLRTATDVLHIYHAEFVEYMDLKTHTMRAGFLVYGANAPEPGTCALFVTGLMLIGIAIAEKRRCRGSHQNRCFPWS